MHFSTIVAALSIVGAAIAQGTTTSSAAAAEGTGALAPSTANNPADTYVATFDTEGKIQGKITIVGNGNSKPGCHVSIQLTGFPAEGGPFPYHVHQAPVPSDGNCTATKLHHDPYGAGETYVCGDDKSLCQTGDLSGKHGKVPADTGSNAYTTEYDDAYISTDSTNPAYIGGLSIVVHLSNKTRIACTNIIKEETPSGCEGPTLSTEANGTTTTDCGEVTESSANASPANPVAPPEFENSAISQSAGLAAILVPLFLVGLML